MRFLGIIASACAGIFLMAGCSDSGSGSDSAGIEIGNPALALSADFSVDYDEVSPVVLQKAASSDELVVLDSFAMDLAEVRYYSSYYVAVSFNPENGVRAWPYEDGEDSALAVSFTGGTSIDEPFHEINLKDEGFLKEIGVFFRPRGNGSAIKGQILQDGKYVPFEYSLSNFKSVGLRYHYSQVEFVSDSLVHMSVVFHARNFTSGIDFGSAEVKDGKILINDSTNADLWKQMNERFISSFRPMRYEWEDTAGKGHDGYVTDIWNGVVGALSDNTIENGNFAEGSREWILVNQFGGVADTSITQEKSGSATMKVKVTEGGTKSYSVQLIQENVALIANKKYKCVFTIWSDKEGEITARIGAYDNYETVGFQKHVNVHTSGQSVEIGFVPSETTPFARFELNLGGSERTFYVKDVKIFRLEK